MSFKNLDYIIQAQNIALTYYVYRSFSLKRLFSLKQKKDSGYAVEALKDVSFNLKRGDNLGILGTNGSGKSTLLRIIAGTYLPDKGNINLQAEGVQLLTLGAGFFNDLTGRDNLYLNALQLGLSKSELDNGLAEQIIAFSELEDKINLPMYTYSSGMKSRLTFSVAACIQPELLLLDEVFSVGDAHFQQKSSERIRQMIHSDKTVIMIAHSEKLISENCVKALWLHKGEVKMFDDADIVSKEYAEFSKYIS
ncbi:MAG: ABC transporter ATP-binding protein [Brevinemataceae bacterium]